MFYCLSGPPPEKLKTLSFTEHAVYMDQYQDHYSDCNTIASQRIAVSAKINGDVTHRRRSLEVMESLGTHLSPPGCEETISVHTSYR